MPLRTQRRSPLTLRERLRQRRRPLILAGLLVAATVAVYAQVGRFDYVLIDDPVYVRDNPAVRAGLTSRSLAWSFGAFHDANWIPLSWLSLMLDSTLAGVRPGGYHLTNVLLHVLNTVLLFAFLVRATGNDLQSAFVAALFALHPLHVESVAWIAERKDVLSILFGLLALLAYADYAKRGRRGSYLASLLCFVCSLMSKQTLVTLPFLLLLLDYWPLRRLALAQSTPAAPPEESPAPPKRGAKTPGNLRAEQAAESQSPSVRRVIWEKVPFLAATVAFSVIALIAQSHGQAVKPLAALSLKARILNALVVYGAYIGQAFYPRNLAVYYAHPGEHLNWLSIGGVAAILVAISVVALVCVRRLPYLFVGWAWYLGTLVPMIGLVQIGNQQMADRYTYFPLIGLFVAATWLIYDIVPSGMLRTRILPVAAIGSLVVLAATTYVQVGYWQNSLTLFRHALDCGRDSAVSRSALGSTLVTRGETAEGLALLESAVALDPKDAASHFHLAVALEKLGRTDAAIEQYQAALALDDWDAAAHNNLGSLLWKRGRTAEAKQHLLRAIQIDPEHGNAYVNLGGLCVETGDYPGAIAFSQRGLAVDPGLLRCHHNIAMALLAQGHLDEAIGRLRYILSVAPDDAEAREKLNRVLAIKRGS